ncbi:unnamed protein product [Tetraodon nigroviridis]|uniref:(spotted green pufferfish) hypothetical protein n=1 Tax=Tetraodon nigroviridis TaxID=99883 RepID=Q4S2F0_TETNG|nr:unnamed protein product [Tetraodon nigroviridis]
MSTMVYPREEKLEKLSQEEIISNTKLVIQGLEALKNEHNSILHSLLETIKCLKKDEEANLVHEKSNLLRKSVEMIELGLGEAQVMMALSNHLNAGEVRKTKAAGAGQEALPGKSVVKGRTGQHPAEAAEERAERRPAGGGEEAPRVHEPAEKV